jgi:hypothetical protein
MYIVLRDGSQFETKPGSNIIFKNNEYVMQYLSVTGVIQSIPVNKVLQVKP